MNFNDSEVERLYSKARDSFYECASGQSRMILLETGVPVESIKTVAAGVSATPAVDDAGSITVETRLNLFNEEGKPLGWYCLHQDEDGNVEDEFLVFE